MSLCFQNFLLWKMDVSDIGGELAIKAKQWRWQNRFNCWYTSTCYFVNIHLPCTQQQYSQGQPYPTSFCTNQPAVCVEEFSARVDDNEKCNHLPHTEDTPRYEPRRYWKINKNIISTMHHVSKRFICNISAGRKSEK